jgi:hypothetical protein
MFVDNLTSFAGKPVVDFPHECNADGRIDYNPASEEQVSEPDRVAWRLRCWALRHDVVEEFLDTIDVTKVTHLVTGYEYSIGPEDAPRLPALRALFVGDIAPEESEISWIEYDDITPLLAAFPDLEHFGIRGSSGLELSPLKNDTLKSLRFETCGLPAEIVRAVGDSDLPALESLDLWLGVSRYGDATIADLEPILGGARLPSLRHLGLENSEIQDEIAAAVAGAPVVARLKTLSLALGILTDRGAEALLSGQPLTHLKRLDLHHHFLSKPMMKRIRAALPGVKVNLKDRMEPEEDPGNEEGVLYVALSE